MTNNRGESLIQVLVAIAIMGVLMYGMLTMVSSQNRDVQGLKEKLAAADIQQQLIRTFADGKVCTKLLTVPSPHFTFATAAAAQGSANPPTVSVPVTELPLSSLPGAPPMATAGALASPVSNSLYVRQNQPFEIANIAGSSNGTTGNYTATFQINFDQGPLIRPLRAASVQIALQTTTAGGIETIIGCTEGGIGNVLSTTTVISADQSCAADNMGNFANCTGLPATVVATCPTGYQVSGCGYILSQWTPGPNGAATEYADNNHSNAPDNTMLNGNGCSVFAGGAPGCGVCFKAQAFCIKLQ